MDPAQRGVDEDKGSPSRGGANLTLTPLPLEEGCPKDRVRVKKKSTDQRKPFGCAITRFSFPPKIKTLQQGRASNRVDKEAKSGIHHVVASAWQFPSVQENCFVAANAPRNDII